MNLAVGRTATIGAAAFILVIAISSWTSDMAEVRDFDEGLSDGHEFCIGLPIGTYYYNFSSLPGVSPSPLPKADLFHDDYSAAYEMGANNGCRRAGGLDYSTEY
jgi:hypothetical protein